MPIIPVTFPGPEGGFFRQQDKKPIKVEIMYSEAESDLENHIIIYRGKVIAKIGDSRLLTDTLIVRNGDKEDKPVEISEGGQTFKLNPQEAFATGQVELIDPDGTLKAKNLWFTWNDDKRKSDAIVGRADDVEAHVATLWIKAASMTQAKRNLTFLKAKVSAGSSTNPMYGIDAEDVQVTPGERATAHSVSLSLFGVNLPRVPIMVFSLDPRANGVQLPRIGYRQGSGFGASWGGDYLLDDKSAVIGNFNIYPEVLPSYRVAYAQSRVPIEEAGINQFAISDSFEDRSNFSFLGSVYNPSQRSTYDRIRVKKDLFTISTWFNYESFGRVTDRKTNYSKPVELAYEKGGPVGDWGYLTQIRGAKIQEVHGNSENRFTLQGSMFSPVQTIGRTTFSTRLDGGFHTDSQSMGFLGGEAGLTYQLRDYLSISGGAYGYKTFGDPTFAGDNYISNQGYVIRGDWQGPSNSLSMLYRYDPQLGWFDRQFRITQVIGSIEPVFVYRQAPRQYQLGIRFRLQDIAKKLQRRDFTQPSEDRSSSEKKGG